MSQVTDDPERAAAPSGNTGAASVDDREDGREYVRWAYRLLLGREPANPEVVENQLLHSDRRRLVETMLLSQEFQPQLARALALRSKRLAADDVANFECDIFEFPVYGQPVKFAILKAATDAYRANLRRGPGYDRALKLILDLLGRNNRRKKAKIVDGGANIGSISLPLATRGHPVLAIEILPSNVAALAQAAIANGLSNLTIVQMALYGKPSAAHFRGFSAWGGVDPTSQTKNICYADTLANIMTLYDFADADIVKLDIEGSELPALAGIETIIDRNDTVEFVYESNSHTCDRFGYKVQDLVQRFERMEFDNYLVRDDHLIPITSRDAQPRIVEDVLATRRDPASPQFPRRTMSKKEMLGQLQAYAFSGNIHYRQHAARQLAWLPEQVGKDEEVAAIYGRLKSSNDPKIGRELAEFDRRAGERVSTGRSDVPDGR